MKGRFISLLLTLGFIFSLSFPVIIWGGDKNIKIRKRDIVKDETVYINLTSQGNLKEINVVNRIETPKDDTYIDYGRYDNVVALSKPVKPKIKGDSIHWELEEDPKGFYYQGNPKDGEPPYILNISYYHKGSKIHPEDLGGKDGKVTIKIKAKPNKNADSKLRDRFYYQLQTELDLDRCSNIKAPRATNIISGRTHNLGFMLMPGKEATFELEFDANDFAFDGFTMTSMDADIEEMIDFDTDAIRDGFDEMNKASGKIVEGTQTLKSGMDKLANGTDKLSKGSLDAKEGLKNFRDGLSKYQGGILELTENAREIDKNLNELAKGGEGLTHGFSRVREGIDKTFKELGFGMLPLGLGRQLEGAIGQLSSGIDEQLAQYEIELGKFASGVTALSKGMGEFTKGLSKLESSGVELLPGLDSIIDGMGQLTQGLSKSAHSIQDVPGEVEKLIDGQKKLGEGLKEASKGIDELELGNKEDKKIISFVSEKDYPRSLQFIYKTEEIGVQKDENLYREPKEINKGFWERFFDLFK